MSRHGKQRIIIVTHKRKATRIFYAGNNEKTADSFFDARLKDFPPSEGYKLRLCIQIKSEGETA